MFDEKFMFLALSQAKLGKKYNEVPIGCVIVRNGEVIAKSYNKREKLKKSTAHAEIEAINKACKVVKDWRLDDCEMYVTLEPCIMCAGAILNSRIKKVYFGAYETKGGAVESVYHLLDTTNCLNWKTEHKGGILEKQCSTLISEFFKSRRSN